MSLITKCASCGTTFRVTQQQLQAHNGKVRCGTCMTVFDGLKELVTLPDSGPEAKPQDAAAAASGFELQPVVPAAVAPAAGAIPSSAGAARAGGLLARHCSRSVSAGRRPISTDRISPPSIRG